MSIPFGDIGGLFDGVKDAADAPKLRRDLAAALTRAAVAEGKIKAVLDLIADPGESHRMLTRKEIGRLLR